MRISSAVVALGVVTTAVAASVLVGSACSFDWDLPAGGGGASDVDGVPDGTLDAPADGDADDAAGDAAGDTDMTLDAGCKSNGDCDFPRELCSFSQGCTGPEGVVAGGVCVNVADASCAPPSGPVPSAYYCACGNHLFTSTCAVAQAGLALDTACTGIDGGYIRCGYAACARATHFCQVSANAHRYECTPWSSVGCASQDCACARTQCPSGTCGGDGGVTLTCP
jgi:hypothetical protein